MFQALTVILLPFVGLSAHGALTVNYSKRTEPAYWSYYLAGLSVMLCAFVATVLLLVVGRASVEKYADLPIQWALAAACVALGQSMVNMALANWQARGDARRYAAHLNLLTLLSLASTILLVAGLGMDWRGRVLGQLLAVGVVGGGVSAGIVRRLRPDFRGYVADIGGVIRFGGPLIPTYTLAAVQLMVGRTIISGHSGLRDTGLYLAGYQLASIFLLVLVAFNQAFGPWLFDRLAHGGFPARLQIVRLTYAYAAVVIPAALLFGLASPAVANFFLPGRFAGAQAFVPWQAVAFAFSGLHMMVVNYVFFAERTSLLLIATATGALANVALSYMLVDQYGPVGATYAQALSSALQFLVVWYLASRVVEMPWTDSRLWRVGRT
jgi:O-antigen/teichoic acid export membrane protein